ncbi:alpha/beta fold hydrolase, partial [Microbispora rosea]
MSMPVVFVHGIRLSGTMWSPVRALLRAPSAAPDLPGHGRRRGLPYGTEAACDVVAETIAGLGGRALVVGLSLGGYVGIATAARHPDLVAGLVAMGCTARPDRPRAHAYRLAGSLRRRRAARRAARPRPLRDQPVRPAHALGGDRAAGAGGGRRRPRRGLLQPPLARPGLAAADEPDAARARFISEYEDTLANPYLAAER